jgi:hypothetical protein
MATGITARQARKGIILGVIIGLTGTLLGLSGIGTQILATGSVVEGIEGLLVRPLGAFQFVGKTEALPIVEILALRKRSPAITLPAGKRL